MALYLDTLHGKYSSARIVVFMPCPLHTRKQVHNRRRASAGTAAPEECELVIPHIVHGSSSYS